MTDINSLKRTIATYINDHRDIVPSFLQRILISMLDASQANEATLPIEEIVIDTENGDTIETAKTKVDTLTTLGFHVLAAPEEIVPFTTPSKAIILSMDESESSGVQIATNTQGDLLLRYCSNAEWSEWAPISDSSLLAPHPNDDVPINDFVKAGGLIWNTYGSSSLPFKSDGFVVSLGWPRIDGYAIQLAFDDSSDSMYMRRRFEKDWKGWVQVYPSQGGGSTSTEATSLQKITLSEDTLDSFLGEKMQYGYASSAVAGLPTGVLILSLGYSSYYGRQYAIDEESFRTWCRYKDGGAWSEWVEINAASEFSLKLTPIGTLKRFDGEVYPVNNITPDKVDYNKQLVYTDKYGNTYQDIPNTELGDYALCLFYTTTTPTPSTPPFFGYVFKKSLDSDVVGVLLGQVPIYVGGTRLNGYNNLIDSSGGNVEVRACYGCYLANGKITVIHTDTAILNDVDDKNYYPTISRRFISRNYTKKYTEYEQCFEISFNNVSNTEYATLPLADTTKTFILSATGVLYRALDGEVEWVPVSFNNDSSKLTITPEGSIIRITKNISDAGFVPTCKAYITIRYIEYD